MERASKRICTARLRIDCDEWRLLCIPDRDGAAIGAAPPRSVLLNCSPELYFWIIGSLGGGWGYDYEALGRY